MISAEIGVAAPLELMLYDGATTKGVRVRIRTTAGVLVNTITLTHVGEGLYTGTWTPTVDGYFHANYIVYTDALCVVEDLLYNRTTEPYKVGASVSPDAVAHAVWDALLADHEEPGSFGEAIAILLQNSDPATISSAVWDESVFDHRIPDTFGDWLQAIWEYCRELVNEVQHPVWGLDELYNKINNSTALLDAHILVNTGKIDALVPLIEGVDTHLTTEIGINRNLLTAMEIQNASDLATIVSQFGITNGKIDSLTTLVGTLQNNTTARLVVPERLVKPDSGTKDYQFHLRIYDTAGNPKAPDETPKIRVRRLDTGVDIVLNALMTPDGAKVGAYYYVFTVTTTMSLYPALVEVSIVEDAITRYIPSVTEISEFEADLDAIQAQLTVVDTKVTNTQSQITNPTYGLAALRNGELDILNAISNEAITLGLIKAKTDLIRADVATTADVADILMQLAEKPSLNDIKDEIELSRDQIMGLDHRNLTEIYDLWDISGLLQTSDPRLNYLDAAISSRSTLTANNVWTAPTRTLTSVEFDPYDAKVFWDYLVSQANTAGSFGKLIRDNLNATVSSRATPADLAPLLSGVAQEDSLMAVRDDLIALMNSCSSKLDNITAKVILIKSKTDKIPNDPAQESTINTSTMQIRDDIADLLLRLIQVQDRTQHLPDDPARQTTLLQIPTNPLLSTDTRLSNLDAKISSRSTLTTSDLALLATKIDVTSARNAIISEIEEQTGLISDLMTISLTIKAKTDRIPVDPATLSSLMVLEAHILDAIDDISMGTIAASDIWSYTNRTLTQDPASFGPDISNLATKDDVAAISSTHSYKNHMTTTFSNITGLQEVLAWAEKDGERVAPTSSCTITIKDSLGATKWTQSSSTPNSDGVYRFINPVVIGSDANYYIIISIVVDGLQRVSQQAFITIG